MGKDNVYCPKAVITFWGFRFKMQQPPGCGAIYSKFMSKEADYDPTAGFTGA
ncbi:MAG: hypothetical protein VKL42_05210 [Snowella sp.]|nr:hypothetical protein [Snowella sp.]